MHNAAILERPAVANQEWTALLTDSFEPHSAFLRGHHNLFSLRTAEADIIAAFELIGFGGQMVEILDEAGGAAIQHAWMRPTDRDGEIEAFEFCSLTADNAFPVTVARFA